MQSDNTLFPETGLPSIIEGKHLTQIYDGNKIVCKDINFRIDDVPNQGQFIVILGPSGCCKSTILRYISGLQQPTSGELLISGKKQTGNHHVGMVFQKYSSLPWKTVLENVALGLKFQGVSKKARLDRAREMIKVVGLEGHENKYAQYPTLSGGQLQRVAIARNLVVNPNMILMDEPFGALDVGTRMDMQDLLCKMYSTVTNMTVILVTHDVREAVLLADEVWLMRSNPGQILDRIKIALPVNRTASIVHEVAYTSIVQDIEDRVKQIQKLPPQ